MLLPGRDLPEVDIVNFDKMAHTGVFALLTYLYMRWYHSKKGIESKLNWALVLALIAYGGIIEVLQGAFYTDRFASWLDFVANGLGCIIVSIFVNRNKTILLLNTK